MADHRRLAKTRIDTLDRIRIFAKKEAKKAGFKCYEQYLAKLIYTDKTVAMAVLDKILPNMQHITQEEHINPEQLQLLQDAVQQLRAIHAPGTPQITDSITETGVKTPGQAIPADFTVLKEGSEDIPIDTTGIQAPKEPGSVDSITETRVKTVDSILDVDTTGILDE